MAHSKHFYQGRRASLGEVPVYTVPAGKVAVVRLISFGNPNPGTTVKANVHGTVGATDIADFAAVVGLATFQPSVNLGFWALNAGDKITVDFQSGTQVDVQVSGELLPA